jgi:hypothetical protein
MEGRSIVHKMPVQKTLAQKRLGQLLPAPEILVRIFFAFGITVCVFVGGCAKKETPISQSPDNGDKKSSPDNLKVTVVSPSLADGEVSPAQTSEDELKVDTPPDAICKMFLLAIRKQDRHDYEKLLTRVSKRNILAANLDLQLPGSDQATCSVADTTYNSHKKDIAMVKCVVHDIVDGETKSFDFWWLLRKQNVGWRIAGMWISTGVGTERDYLSFENTEDVAKINAMANGVRQAAGPGTGKTQLK